MSKRASGRGFVAAMFLMGVAVSSADAGVATPYSVVGEAVPALVMSVGWACGERRCFWRQDYTGPVPPFAATWGPPDSPTCYYVKRRISKKWRQVCPEIPWQAR